MKNKALVFMIVMFTFLGVTAFGAEVDPLNNELFQIVSEISADEYYSVEDNMWTETGALNTESPYYYQFPDYRDMEKYPYNDGIKKDYYTYVEEYQYMDVDGTLKDDSHEYQVSGLYDINGTLLYTNPVLETSAMSGFYSYNLGYVVNSMVYWMDDGNTKVLKTFENIFTGEIYDFFVDECTGLLNDGSMFFKYGDKFYKVQLIKPAIVTVLFNGRKLYFDQVPVIEDGRTLVPVRAIFEELGATIDWNGDTQTVTAIKDDVTISLTINNLTATKNGEVITLDVPAKIIGGRTLVPVRFVSDCFGVGVDWNATGKQVVLTSK